LKTALEIIYYGSEFQKSETHAARERCKMRVHFEKPRAAQSATPA
jgi:hypothetical protein